MNSRHLLAVDLLMSDTDASAAETLGITLRTLHRWMAMPGFAEAQREQDRIQRQSLARVSRQAALKAAASLCLLAGSNGTPTKMDPKVLLDVVKISGAFEKDDSDSADALIEIINRTMNSDEEEAGKGA